MSSRSYLEQPTETLQKTTAVKTHMMCAQNELWLKARELNIEVGTVEGFQGTTKRVIIVSTVRARCDLVAHDAKFRLGFLVDAKPLTFEEVLAVRQNNIWRRSRLILILIFWATMAMFLSMIVCLLLKSGCGPEMSAVRGVPPVHLTLAPLMASVREDAHIL